MLKVSLLIFFASLCVSQLLAQSFTKPDFSLTTKPIFRPNFTSAGRPKCPMVRCQKGCSSMISTRGCPTCFCYHDCRRMGCPRGYYCRRGPFLQMPAYSCVRRLKCPAITRPTVNAQRYMCLRCQKSCNCMKCRPGYVCCRDYYGCVKCVRGIPY